MLEILRRHVRESDGLAKAETAQDIAARPSAPGLGAHKHASVTSTEIATVSPRPMGGLSVGLALSGGAARGFAHIGVIRTLVAHGIKPDVIAGTSIGAVVGACYAAGCLDEFEDWARSLTRRGVFGYLDISLSGSGLIGGDRLSKRLTSVLGEWKIQDLPMRFAAICTEIGTGHEIWLTRGRLSEAVEASYALPGIFPPVRIGGRWLMDGALVNPLPISAARALGARLVIGVNLNADNFGRGTIIQDHGPDESDILRENAPQERSLRDKAEALLKRKFLGTSKRPGISTVMVEAFQVMQDRITRARLAGDPPDVLISPRLARLHLFEFHRADEAIALGREATERAIEDLGAVVETLS